MEMLVVGLETVLGVEVHHALCRFLLQGLLPHDAAHRVVDNNDPQHNHGFVFERRVPEDEPEHKQRQGAQFEHGLLAHFRPFLSCAVAATSPDVFMCDVLLNDERVGATAPCSKAPDSE